MASDDESEADEEDVEVDDVELEDVVEEKDGLEARDGIWSSGDGGGRL